ncbi:NB-ARC domain disease resistance protein [Medicago truncatula]|uniref:NB-ARC domain disease resistance protein n=1 Tax=Medicago truncatula TaxID=3880 RepID=G7I6E8_MEDTR|nr:NB-ARC domain disease resistance protein [Medicago truncatula]
MYYLIKENRMVPRLPNSPYSCMPNDPQTFTNPLVSPFITPTCPMHKQIRHHSAGNDLPQLINKIAQWHHSDCAPQLMPDPIQVVKEFESCSEMVSTSQVNSENIPQDGSEQQQTTIIKATRTRRRTTTNKNNNGEQKCYESKKSQQQTKTITRRRRNKNNNNIYKLKYFQSVRDHVFCLPPTFIEGKLIIKNIIEQGKHSSLPSKEVVGHFECRVWITMSQSYNIEVLLRCMLKKLHEQKVEFLPKDIYEMDRGELIFELRKYLQNKRYVFVFDNVWNTSFWDEIEYAMSDHKNGSKIFITTRNMDVAIYCKKSSFIQAFQFDFEGCCPKELIDISFEIARKCKGLPLAIVTIGGLLSTKEKNAFEWQRFSENMTLELKNDSHLTGIKKILGFKDYEVKSKRVIRQWIAEGFVKEESGKTLEEVAEGYLSELIRRSLVQVSSVSIDGKSKSCCVHDLIRIMFLEKCEDLSFFKHFNEVNHSSLSGTIRRLSIATYSSYLRACIENSHIRSVFFFTNKSKYVEISIMSRILKKHRTLKVLDFQDNISGLYQNVLPKWIGLLLNLETLDLRSSSCFTIIPKEISKLRKLCHLMGYNICLFQLKDVIGGMESLQTLTGMKIGKGGIELIKELGKLRQLRKFSLFDVRLEHSIALSSSLNEMRHSEKLCIMSRSGDDGVFDVIDLHLVSLPPMLRNLKLCGKLENFPEISQLQNLVKFDLADSFLTDDPIKYLENMFSKSKRTIYIGHLSNLNSIVIDKGALHSLKKFELFKIPNLKNVPSGIQHFREA